MTAAVVVATTWFVPFSIAAILPVLHCFFLTGAAALTYVIGRANGGAVGV